MGNYSYKHLGHPLVIDESKIVEIRTPTAAELTADAMRRLNHPEMKKAPIKKKKGGSIKKRGKK